MARPPLPPFTQETALQKVRMAEDGWNSRNAAKVSLAYTEGSKWRNRDMFINGRGEIEIFLTQKWQDEQDYRLIKELWARLKVTALPFAMPMNRIMRRDNGFALMAMKIGNLMRMV